MQDNARSHTAIIVRDYLQEVGISVMRWPARSPDLNPIEHLWDDLKRRVRARDSAPTTLQELQDAALEKWDRIPQETRSTRERLEAVIRARRVTLGFRLSLDYLNNCIFGFVKFFVV
jgi:transposase